MIATRLAAGALLAIALSGCTTGGSPSNVFLIVGNESAYAGTVHWVSPGLFGLPLFPDTGTDDFSGCSRYMTAFGSGHHSVSINVDSNSLTLELDGARDASETRYVLVDASGQSAQVDAQAIPTEGCGHL